MGHQNDPSLMSERTVDLLLAYQRIPLVRGTRARGKLCKRVTRLDAYWYWRITLVWGDESPRPTAGRGAPYEAVGVIGERI